MLVGAEEPKRRHALRNDMTVAAAQMQLALEQVRERREVLLAVIRRDIEFGRQGGAG